VVHRFAREHAVPWMDFVKGQRKDDVAQEYLGAFTAAGRTEGVLFVGRAQEKTALFRTEKRRTPEGRPYPWIVKATGMVNREVPGRLRVGAGVGAGSPRPRVDHPVIAGGDGVFARIRRLCRTLRS
jgi:hypothetical protein